MDRLSDLIFEIKEKITDQEYKNLMELGSEIFKSKQSKFYEITHLEPRMEYQQYDPDDEDEDDGDYYKLCLIPQKTILKMDEEVYTERILTEVIPSELQKNGYCEVKTNEFEPKDLFNNIMDEEVKSPFYHVIAIKPLQ